MCICKYIFTYIFKDKDINQILKNHFSYCYVLIFKIGYVQRYIKPSTMNMEKNVYYLCFIIKTKDEIELF